MKMNKVTNAILELQNNKDRNGAELVKDQICKAIGLLRKSNLFGSIKYMEECIDIDGMIVGKDFMSVKNFIQLCNVKFNNRMVSRANDEINFRSITSPVLVIDGQYFNPNK